MPRNQFIDVATGEVYTWQVNHASVSSAVRKRMVEHTYPTAGGWVADVAPILQQGSDLHEIHQLEGMVANQAQHEALQRFWQISTTRTIHWIAATGGRYEVIVRSYLTTRHRVIRGPHGARGHIWKYTMELEIVALIA